MRYFICDFCNPITWFLKVHFIDENAASHCEQKHLIQCKKKIRVFSTCSRILKVVTDS